jgi:hypothetical protein
MSGEALFETIFPPAIVARRFSGGDGSLLGAVVQLSQRTGWDEQPALAALPHGHFVAVWNEVASRQVPGTLFVRAFNGDCTLATRERFLGAGASTAQGHAALADLPAPPSPRIASTARGGPAAFPQDGHQGIRTGLLDRRPETARHAREPGDRRQERQRAPVQAQVGQGAGALTRAARRETI